MAPERSVTTRVCSQPGCPNPASQLGPRPPNTPPGTHVYLYGAGPFGSPALTVPPPPVCPGAMIPTKKLSPLVPPPAVGPPPSSATASPLQSEQISSANMTSRFKAPPLRLRPVTNLRYATDRFHRAI